MKKNEIIQLHSNKILSYISYMTFYTADLM